MDDKEEVKDMLPMLYVQTGKTRLLLNYKDEDKEKHHQKDNTYNRIKKITQVSTHKT